MRIVNVSSRSLKKMPELQVSRSVVNTEGKLYIYGYKDKWLNVRELLKIYYIQSDEYLSDKIYVVTQLLANKEKIDIPELILPSALVAVDGNISGFSMPLVENNVNLSVLLGNPKYSLKFKLKFLAEILQILKKVESLKDMHERFFLGDIHEGNFIWDLDNQLVRAVDIDSSYINGSTIAISKFLTFNEKFENNPKKYPMSELEERPIPNRETSLACFWLMLLNVLSGDSAYRWSHNEFYSYLSFLKTMGIDRTIIEELSNIYTPAKFSDIDPKILYSIDSTKDYTLERARIPRTCG